ncbi:response regulator [Pseudomonas putida]|uniref:response regulator n=1 Tax=Pseudomonas putida TaxID=303 RepID=UPI00383A7CA5
MMRRGILPLRIVLLDDHTLIREALKVRLAQESDFEVVGAYATSSDLLTSLRTHEVDLLILDYQLADGEVDGLSLIKAIRLHHPQLRIVIFSSVERVATVNLCLRAGAGGFVGKTEATEVLIKAVRVVALGRTYLVPTMAAELDGLASSEVEEGEAPVEGAERQPESFGLSPKEHEVLRCMAGGLSVTDVSRKFSRSVKTISGQKRSGYRKLGVVTDLQFLELIKRGLKLF